MTITYFPDLIQGSDEWLAARLGMITASEMRLLVTPTLKRADNEKTRAHLFELLAQRITKFVEPHYISDDMLRGMEDEVRARYEYTKRYAPVEDCGFITNDEFGFTLGYSPDGLVGADGAIEAKSRRGKFQVQTIIENVLNETIPADYVMQHQTGLLVTKRKWIDFISYSGGLPMAVIRVWPDEVVQDAILDAAAAAEKKIAELRAQFDEALASEARLVPTERTVEQEMHL